MAGDINYKLKYQELKLNFKKSVDLAFRLGFVEGSKQASQQASQQAAQQNAVQMDQMSQHAGEQDVPQPGDNQSAPMPGGAQPSEQPQPAVEAAPMAESEHPDGTELDQHISKLESMLSKSELDPQELKSYVSAMKQEVELKKSAEAIKGISKALHTPKFKISAQANHNMSDSSKKAVTLQHKIVSDIMKKWEQEEMGKATKDISQVLKIEGIIKD